jgi:hypothetical protein
VINKKAQGKSHFKRTKNWRKSLTEGVNNFKDAYNSSRAFYDAIAEIEDREAYKTELVSRIEGTPGWRKKKPLVDFHEKLSAGRVLTVKQKGLLMRLTGVAEKRRAPVPKEKPAVPPVPSPEPAPAEEDRTQERIQRMRKLWVAARARGNTWVMDFAKSIGEKLKSGRSLTPGQMKKLMEVLDDYGV